MIWIIGGTKDSRDILERLIKETDKDIIVRKTERRADERLDKGKQYNGNSGRKSSLCHKCK